MQNKEVYDELVAKFEKMYGEKPQVVAYAPGRIEVLGNHTDYNEGYFVVSFHKCHYLCRKTRWGHYITSREKKQ